MSSPAPELVGTSGGLDFGFDEDQLAVRELAREFAENEIAPGVLERDAEGRFPTEVLEQAAELGFCGMVVPEEWGGSGLDPISYCLVLEEIARVCPSTAVTLSVTNSVCAQPIHRFGNDDQRERFLRRLASGECLGGFMLTEPGSGSDAKAMVSTAKRDGDDWILDGTKAWVTNAGAAEVYVVMARSGEGPKDITSFIVEASAPGLSIARYEDKMGLRASKTAMITLDGVRVPDDQRLGEVGQGMKVALGSLDRGRLGISAQAVGMAEGALEASASYAKERKAFGRPIGDYQAIQWMLADMRLRQEASRVLLHAAAADSAAGRLAPERASMAKLTCTENAKWICDQAVQVHGGNGYSREYLVERMHRDVRVTTIYEGSSQIQQLVIGRSLLRD
ncbi:MAG: acyl-CoA dehydrogenase family protein [Acidobacteriota bacterium]